MSPILKAYSLSFSLATSIVYIIWQSISQLKSGNWFVSFIITFVLSLSFYRFMIKIIFFLCKKIKIVKKLIFGRNYFAGLWIGYFTVDGAVEYYYEIFEQDLDGLTIKGKSFDKNREYSGEWTIIHPNWNIEDSKFTYYYEMDVLTQNDITLGYSRATIYWDKHGKANKLIGFAIDNYSSNKQPYVSVKINDTTSFENWIETNFWNNVEKIHKNSV